MENNLIFMKKISGNYNTELSKKKLDGIIFTRACCCVGVVIFHYFCHSRGDFKLLYTTANSPFGFIFVTCFFNISGAILYYNYPFIKSIKSFYFKRWKSLFPSFYICYLYFFFSLTLRFRKLLFKDRLERLFITILGMDGYFLYRIRTCYLIGEWFLGAIIIIYILYPILSFFVTKNCYGSFLILCVLNIFMYCTNFFIIRRTRNIITCITSFYSGIISVKFKTIFFMNNISFIISFVTFILLSTIKIYPLVIIFQIQGFSFFIALTKIGQYVIPKKYGTIFIKISNLSYSIYLIHHRILNDLLSLNNPLEWYSHILYLSLALLVIIICSQIHLIVVDSILKSNIFRKLELLFI